jgi:hypothetical protein
MVDFEIKIQMQLGTLLLSNMKYQKAVDDLNAQLRQATEGHAEVVTGLLAKLADYEGPAPEVEDIIGEGEECSQQSQD